MSLPSHALGRALIVLVVALVGVGLLTPFVHAQETGAERSVDILQLDGPLTPPMMRSIHRAIADAESREVELLVIEIDAPGAIAVDPHAVVGPLRDAAVPIVVWAGPHTSTAAGAGVLLLAAAHLPAASRFAEIGPACPAVVERGCDDAERALITALLELRGADVEIAATTMSGEDAREAGLVGLLAEGLVPLLEELDGREIVTAAGARTLDISPEGLTVRFANPGLLARILDASLDPMLVYLLVLSVLFLLLFEIFQPGFGVAGIAALIILPLAVYGLVVLPVAWWAVALIVVGMGLLAVDLAIAGLGVPTAGGAAALFAGSWWLFASDHPLMSLPLWLMLLAVVFAVVFFVAIMTVVLRAQVGPEVSGVGEELVGKVGVVRSTMNPEGHVFVDGALWRAKWTGESRSKVKTGTRVRVVGFEETELLVDTADAAPDSDSDSASDESGHVRAGEPEPPTA